MSVQNIAKFFGNKTRVDDISEKAKKERGIDVRIILRRFLGVWLAAAVSLCSVSGVNGSAEGNEGQDSQMKVRVEKITTKFWSVGLWSLSYPEDSEENGNKMAYRWKAVSVDGKKEKVCFCISVRQGKLEEKKIKFNQKTKQFLKKKTIENGAEWQDKQGNFFFVTSKTGKDKKVIQTLHRVDKKGQITKSINLNKWLKITQKSNATYSLYIHGVKDDTVVLEYRDYKKAGYVLADRNTGKIKKQVVYNHNRGDGFFVKAVTSSKLVGFNGEEKLVVASLTKEKKIKLSSGNTIKYAEVKEYTLGETLPQEEGRHYHSFGIYKNKVYLFTSAGYYKINVQKAVCEKIASKEEMDFIHREVEALTEKDVTVDIMPVADGKFYIMPVSYDETWTNPHTLWLCTLG